ncbi:MAG: hypothetical protein ACI9R3_004615 [Verrucomicrobiales bacterium]
MISTEFTILRSTETVDHQKFERRLRFGALRDPNEQKLAGQKLAGQKLAGQKPAF